MCEFASFVVKRSGEVLWWPGVDNHHRILELAGINDSTDRVVRELAKVEIIPPPRKGDRAKLCDWRFRLDEVLQPMWWDENLHRPACYEALARLVEAEAKGFETVYPDTGYIVGKREHGVKIGLWEEVEGNGSWSQERYRNGKRHGRQMDIYCDGGMWMQMYRDGRTHGFSEEVEPNGSWKRYLCRDGRRVRTTSGS